jgi:GGDEF domain-containing protein
MNRKLLAKLQAMTDDQLYSAIYRDELTGVLNRRALTLDEDMVALVDMDSLKYVNDTQGHRTGDQYLIQLAQSLVAFFGQDCVYRVSGDEFLVKFPRGASMEYRSSLFNLRRDLPWFSFGVGFTFAEADHWLRRDKHARERSGKRAARGLTPPWAEQMKRAAI